MTLQRNYRPDQECHKITQKLTCGTDNWGPIKQDSCRRQLHKPCCFLPHGGQPVNPVRWHLMSRMYVQDLATLPSASAEGLHRGRRPWPPPHQGFPGPARNDPNHDWLWKPRQQRKVGQWLKQDRDPLEYGNKICWMLWGPRQHQTKGVDTRIPLGPSAAWGPYQIYPRQQPISQNCLAKMDEFTREDMGILDDVTNQVKENIIFYGWIGTKTCHLSRSQLRGTYKPIWNTIPCCWRIGRSWKNCYCSSFNQVIWRQPTKCNSLADAEIIKKACIRILKHCKNWLLWLGERYSSWPVPCRAQQS